MITKGQTINDRYQVIKSIGEGGMANVYLGYDTILNRNVAIKVLRGDLAADEKFVRRFQREALSASSLSHPNIVEVYDVGDDNGQYYIVMEYVEGRHLKSLLKKRNSLTLNEVLDIMLQITDGMASAHDSYIIHRDIKPQNILILDNGQVKITDFGIAMAINSTQLTQTNSVMGSVHYLPPEQASGKGSSLKSDVYSMGILMFELLTGVLPFKGDNAVEIALKHLKEPLPNLKDILPNIPQSVENIVLKATSKNPKNRYNDAREMHEDLKTVLSEERLKEALWIPKYPDIEFDDTKVMKMIEKEKKEEEEGVIAKQITNQERKKQNKLMLVLGSILAGLVVIITTIVVLLPFLSGGREITVPEVNNLSVPDAIKKLQDAGFKVADEQKEITDATVEEGKVVKTNPAENSKRIKGTTITLYVSTGNKGVIVEDWKGKNYLEVKAKLEVFGIYVIVEKQSVDSTEKYKEGEIISQSINKGEKLEAGDTITFYIPDIVTKYPNFCDGSFSLADVQAFADEYQINLEIEYVESNQYTEGTIIYQSRPEGYTITAGTNFSIKVVKVPEEDNIDCVPGLC